jgi:hypothetical protein
MLIFPCIFIAAFTSCARRQSFINTDLRKKTITRFLRKREVISQGEIMRKINRNSVLVITSVEQDLEHASAMIVASW